LSSISFAQLNEEIDSIKLALVSTDISDSTRTDNYNRLGELLVFQSPDSAKKYLKLALNLATETGDDSKKAKSLLLQGAVYEGQSKYDSAIFFGEEAYQVFESIGDSIFMADALSNIGLAYEAKGLKEKGVSYHLQALRLFQAEEDLLGIGKTFNNLGILFKTMGKLNDAADYYKKASEVFSQMDFPFGKAALLNNAAGVQIILQQYDSAYYNAKEALAIFTEQQIEQHQPSALEIIGTALFYKNKIDQAIDTLSKATVSYTHLKLPTK